MILNRKFKEHCIDNTKINFKIIPYEKIPV